MTTGQALRGTKAIYYSLSIRFLGAASIGQSGQVIYVTKPPIKGCFVTFNA